MHALTFSIFVSLSRYIKCSHSLLTGEAESIFQLLPFIDCAEKPHCQFGLLVVYAEKLLRHSEWLVMKMIHAAHDFWYGLSLTILAPIFLKSKSHFKTAQAVQTGICQQIAFPLYEPMRILSEFLCSEWGGHNAGCVVFCCGNSGWWKSLDDKGTFGLRAFNPE